MGARARYSHGEGITAPTCIGRQSRPVRSKRRRIFLTFCASGICYRAAPFGGSPMVDFSDATVETCGVSARTGGISRVSAVFCGAAAGAGSDVLATGAPAPRRSRLRERQTHRPHPHRTDHHVLVNRGRARSSSSIARNSSGFNAGLRSSISAARPADIGRRKRGARRHLVFAVRRRQEHVDARGRNRDCRRRDWTPRTDDPARRSR